MTYHLLQFSHGLWMARNGFLHERDDQGLLLKEGQTLHEAITERFNRGKRTLLQADHHLVEHRSLALLLALSPPDKYTWLAAITMAHRLYKQTRRSDNVRMRTHLTSWLTTGVCRQTTTSSNNSEHNTQPPNNNNDDDDEA